MRCQSCFLFALYWFKAHVLCCFTLRVSAWSVSRRLLLWISHHQDQPSCVSVLRSPRFFRLHQSRKQFSEIIPTLKKRVCKAGSVESECLTFDLSYISVQLLSNHPELLPLLLHSTLSLLQLLVQLQEPTALLEPELHLSVGRMGRVFSSLLQDAEHRIIRSSFADVLQDLVHSGRLRPAGQHHPLLTFRAKVHSAGGRASPQIIRPTETFCWISAAVQPDCCNVNRPNGQKISKPCRKRWD